MAERLNLDNLVSSAVHSHNYERIDGSAASNSKYVKQAEIANGIIGSPRNIKKLFIKSTGVDVVYYRPLLGRKVLSEFIPFSGSDKMLLLKALNDYAREYMSQSEMTNSSVTISGTGFGSFLTDLSVSNLEELYFDWTLLLGNKELFGDFFTKNRSAGGSGNFLGLGVRRYERCNSLNSIDKVKEKTVDAMELDSEYWNKTGTGKLLAGKLYNYIVKQMCGSKPGGLLKNYPRLKYIGFIGNSKAELKSNGEITKELLKDYDCLPFFKMFEINEIGEKLCDGDKFRFSVFLNTGVDLLSTSFRVDSGIYQFDKVILEDYFKSTICNRDMTREAELTKWFNDECTTRLGLESKLEWVKKFRDGELNSQKFAKKDNILKKVDSSEADDITEGSSDASAEPADEKVTNQLEMALNMVEDSEKLEGLIFQLECLITQYGKASLCKLVNEFTPKGKEYYNNLIKDLKDR